MADDEWQMEAVHEQFNVFDTLITPYEKIQSTDFRRVYMEVEKIRSLHLKIDKPTTSARHISLEIMKHADGNEIKLSFIVIVTDIEINGSLCRMPIFVIMSSGKKKFIDMNLTLFNSWEVFLNSNDFPPCQYCFPFGGQYCVGGKLKIDFALSPAATRQNVNFMWKGLGFMVGVCIVVGSFFFTIPQIKHSKADSLLSIANEFVPGIRKYVCPFLRAVTLMQRFRSGDIKGILEVLPEICRILIEIHNNFKDEISLVFKKVRDALRKLYNWIIKKLSGFFENATEWAQHMFIAVAIRVDEEIITVQSEAEDMLEASRNNNHQSQTTVIAAAIHAQEDTERGMGYANSIFRNAKNDSALQNGMKNKDENLHPITSDLLEISSSLAQKLGKTTLKDAQDIFEALSSIVKDEFKKKIKIYSKMLVAAKAGAGHEIDLEVYNRSLGIEGDPKEYYWQEAFISVVNSPIANQILKDKIESLEKEKKILILPIQKRDEDDINGVYRLVGVSGAGKFTANELIKNLKETETQFDLNDSKLVINETSSVIMIRTEDLTLAAKQEVNSENTSEGFLLVMKMEA